MISTQHERIREAETPHHFSFTNNLQIRRENRFSLTKILFPSQMRSLVPLRLIRSLFHFICWAFPALSCPEWGHIACRLPAVLLPAHRQQAGSRPGPMVQHPLSIVPLIKGLPHSLSTLWNTFEQLVKSQRGSCLQAAKHGRPAWRLINAVIQTRSSGRAYAQYRKVQLPGSSCFQSYNNTESPKSKKSILKIALGKLQFLQHISSRATFMAA